MKKCILNSPETPQERDAHLRNEIGVNFSNDFFGKSTLLVALWRFMNIFQWDLIVVFHVFFILSSLLSLIFVVSFFLRALCRNFHVQTFAGEFALIDAFI